MLKLKPFEIFVGDSEVISYVGIRSDEKKRVGYISTKPNIRTVFPFVEENIRHEDVLSILARAGLGLPKYYHWRSRSGCYFCFFQQKREWVGLLENHPHFFEKAKAFEKFDPITGARFTWNQDESLLELSDSKRVAEIKEDYNRRLAQASMRFCGNQTLNSIWGGGLDESTETACNICHL